MIGIKLGSKVSLGGDVLDMFSSRTLFNEASDFSSQKNLKHVVLLMGIFSRTHKSGRWHAWREDAEGSLSRSLSQSEYLEARGMFGRYPSRIKSSISVNETRDRTYWRSAQNSERIRAKEAQVRSTSRRGQRVLIHFIVNHEVNLDDEILI